MARQSIRVTFYNKRKTGKGGTAMNKRATANRPKSKVVNRGTRKA